MKSHRDEKLCEDGYPIQLETYKDKFDKAIFLQPVKDKIEAVILKDGSRTDKKYTLDPATMMISYPEHQIYKDEQICTHCGSCIAVCPTDALYIKRPEMEIIFDKDKCSVCELCILTCPTRAMGLFSTQKTVA